MDGQNCRSPVRVYEAWESNSRNNFRSIEEIVAAAVEPGMSDKEKAIALWYQECESRVFEVV